MKILPLCVFCVVSGCAAFDFDAIEYNRIIETKLLAEKALPYCGSEEIKPYIEAIDRKINLQAEYSKYRSVRINVYKSSIELQKMVRNFSDASSKEFCKQKLLNVIAATSRMAESLGR